MPQSSILTLTAIDTFLFLDLLNRDTHPKTVWNWIHCPLKNEYIL